MGDRPPIGRTIIIWAMAYCALAACGWTVVVWGALAEWEWDFLAGVAVSQVMICAGIWTATRLTRSGLMPRSVAAFAVCGVIGCLLLMFSLAAARPDRDPQEEAKWVARFWWFAPTGCAVGVSIIVAGLLLYLPAVGRYLAEVRALQQPAADSNPPPAGSPPDS